MNDTAATLNRLSYSVDKAIDRLTSPLAQSIPAAIRQHAVTDPSGTPVITPLGYALVMRRVDEELRKVYGAFRGDRNAPMYRIVAQAATAAHRMPVEATVSDVRRRLKREPELLEALEGPIR